MAFLSKVGSILNQTTSKKINGDLSATKPFIYQALSLRETFSKYGKVIEARVKRDRETGRSRGSGFVTYLSNADVFNAIQALDGQDLHGSRVKVNDAADGPPPRFQSSYGGDSGYGGGGDYSGGGGGGGYSGYGGGGNYNNDGCCRGYGEGGNFNSPGSYGGGVSAGGYGGNAGYGSGGGGGFGGSYKSSGSNFSGSGLDEA